MTLSSKHGFMTAQALLLASGNRIAVDGMWGPASKAAFTSVSKADQSKFLDIIRVTNGEAAAVVNANYKPVLSDFDQVIEALKNEAKKRNLPNVEYYIAQIVLETGWGRHVPRSGATKTWNYGGIKTNSVPGQSSGSVRSITSEVYNGKKQTIEDSFAVFDGPEHFAEVYFWYIFDGGSAYRYKGVEKARSAFEFGDILQKNGYATDPLYANKIAAIVTSVKRRYSNLA